VAKDRIFVAGHSLAAAIASEVAREAAPGEGRLIADAGYKSERNYGRRDRCVAPRSCDHGPLS
jgi:hypothetical protein